MKKLKQNKIATMALALCISAPLLAETQFANHLMPQPAELSVNQGAPLTLDSTFAVETLKSTDTRLTDAVERAVRRIELTAGLRHSGTGVTPTTKLVVSVDTPGEAVQTINENENYSLTVTSTGIAIHAATDVGAIHALETLVQLVQPGGAGKGYILPAVAIEDTPRFPWRGLMIDCGRHFEPVEVIKRTLDGMAAVKLNVFHWHLTEDQGFRMQSLVYPKLTEKGSDGLFYTQDQAREIVAYARARGIRVVPEFEMPGHSTAWLVAYPELASGTTPDSIRREFGVSNYAIDPTREETYVFIKRFLSEMASIFPDAYVHIGGDETPAPDWKKNPRILSFMKAHQLKNNDALQAYFNTRILQIVAHLHRHMMGWDEIFTPGLPKDVVVQSWRGEASLAKGAKLGYDGVLSAPYYLDGMNSADEYYLADPLPSTMDLSADERKHILGGEVCMWGEHLYANTIDSRIWPRSAAIAERFWSPEKVRDVDDMYRRLEPISIELEGLGLTHLQFGDVGLRALAGVEQIDALRTFSTSLEPVGLGERYSMQHTDQLTPLDSLADAIRPDPPTRYWFQVAVKHYLADARHNEQDRTALSTWLKQLADAVPVVEQQMTTSPRLADASLRADQLQQLTAIGQQALQYLTEGQDAPTGWKAKQLQVIKEAKKPSALVRFVFLPSFEELIKAVPEK